MCKYPLWSSHYKEKQNYNTVYNLLKDTTVLYKL